MTTLTLPTAGLATEARLSFGRPFEDELDLRVTWGQGSAAHPLGLRLSGRPLGLPLAGAVSIRGRLGHKRKKKVGPVEVDELVWAPDLRVGEAALAVSDVQKVAREIVAAFGDRADTFFTRLEGEIAGFVNGVFDTLIHPLIERLPAIDLPGEALDLDGRPALRQAARAARRALHGVLASPLAALRRAVEAVCRGLLEAGAEVVRAVGFLRVLLADPAAYFKGVAATLAAQLAQHRGALLELLGQLSGSAFAQVLGAVWRTLVERTTIAWTDVRALLDALWDRSRSAMRAFGRRLGDALAALPALAEAQLARLADGAVWLWERLAAEVDDAGARLAKLLVDVTAKALDRADRVEALCRRVLERLRGRLTFSVARFGEFLTALGRLPLIVAVCRVLRLDRAGLFERFVLGPAAAVAGLFDALGLCLDGLGASVTGPLLTIQRTFHGLAELSDDLDLARSAVEEAIVQLQGRFSQVALAVLREAKGAIERDLERSPLLRALGLVVQALFDLLERIGGVVFEVKERLRRDVALRLQESCAELVRVVDSLAAFARGAAAGKTGPVTIRCRARHIALEELTGPEGSVTVDEGTPELLRGEGAQTIIELFRNVFGITRLTTLELHAYGQRLETPLPVVITAAALPDETGARLDRLQDLILPPLPPALAALLPTVRLGSAARFFPVDPRYAWAYGSSLQLAVADLDGDGALAGWEQAAARAQLGTEDARFDVDKDGVVTANDLRLIAEQASHYVNGVPYTEAAAPLGVLLDWPNGSWVFLTVASLADEDVGLRRSPAPGVDYRASTVVDRLGVGLFAHGQLNLPDLTFGLLGVRSSDGAPPVYPVRFALEPRVFADAFPQTPPLFAVGASNTVVLRGGAKGNDWQLRLRTNQLPGFAPVPPPATWAFTVRSMVQLTGSGGAIAAIEGAFKLGLEYSCGTPAIELADRLRKTLDVGVDAAGELTDPQKALRAILARLQLEQVARLGGRVVAPWLSLLCFDPALEARLMVAERLLSWDDPTFRPELITARELLQGARGPSGIEGMATGWPFATDAALTADRARLAELDEEEATLRGAQADRERHERRRAACDRTLAAEAAAVHRLEELSRARDAGGPRRALLELQVQQQRRAVEAARRAGARARADRAAAQAALAELPPAAELEALRTAAARERAAVAARLDAALRAGGRRAELVSRCGPLLEAHRRARAWSGRAAALEALARRRAGAPAAEAAALDAERARLEALPAPTADELRQAAEVDATLARVVQRVKLSPEVEQARAEEAQLAAERPRLEAELEAGRRQLAALQAERARWVAARARHEASPLTRPLALLDARRVEELDRELAALASAQATRQARLAEVDARRAALAARAARAADGSPLDPAFEATWRGATRGQRIAVWRDAVTEEKLLGYGQRLEAEAGRLAAQLLSGKVEAAWATLRGALGRLRFDPLADAAGLGDAPLAVVQLIQLVLIQARTLRYLGDEMADPSVTLRRALGLDDGDLALFRDLEWSGGLGSEVDESWDVVGSARGKVGAGGDGEGEGGGAKEGKLPGLRFGEDTLSVVWSLDGGGGVGAGGEAAGEGAAATATAGVTICPPTLTFPVGLLLDLRAVIVFARLLVKLVRHGLHAVDQGVTYFRTRGVTFDSLLEGMALWPAWYLIALCEAMKELVADEANWLEAFLGGCKLSLCLKGKLEASAAATIGVEVRGEVAATASVTLAAVLDPLITILEGAGRDLPRDGARQLLSDRLVPKLEVEVTEELTASARAACFEGVVTANGTWLTGDFMLWDGSPWRATLEGWLKQLADLVWEYGRARGATAPTPALEGAQALLRAVDDVLAGSVNPLDAPLPSLVGQPAVRSVLDLLRGAGQALEQAGTARPALTACLEALDRVRPSPVRAPEGWLVVEPHPETAGRSRLHAYFSDEDVAALGAAARAPLDLENVTYALPVGSAPATVGYNAFDLGGGARLEGLAVGFETAAAASGFAAQRAKDHPDWVPAAAATAVWDHAGRWFAWLTTALIERCVAQGLPAPAASLEGGAVVLRFEHVARGATAGLGLGSPRARAGADLYRRVLLLDEALSGELHTVQARLYDLARI